MAGSFGRLTDLATMLPRGCRGDWRFDSLRRVPIARSAYCTGLPSSQATTGI